MHFIQKYILDELRVVKSARYAQLKPDEIESGHFRYHLKQLLKTKYITQEDRGVYSLSLTGMAYVDKLSTHKVTFQQMPKVITYTLLIDGQNLLLQKKNKQPYIDLLNMIGGKLHEDETAQDASTREVYEKTGVTIQESEYKGLAEIIMRNGTSLLTHVIAFVYIKHVDAAQFNPQTVEIIDSKNVADLHNLAPDFLRVYENIANDESIFVDTIILDLKS